jgi:signal transduction histidine kinase
VGPGSEGAADRELEKYVAAVARELRDPLRTILHLAQMIRDNDGALDGRTSEYAEYIRASAERVYDAINSLGDLRVARSAAGAGDSHGEPPALATSARNETLDRAQP